MVIASFVTIWMRLALIVRLETGRVQHLPHSVRMADIVSPSPMVLAGVSSPRDIVSRLHWGVLELLSSAKEELSRYLVDSAFTDIQSLDRAGGHLGCPIR